MKMQVTVAETTELINEILHPDGLYEMIRAMRRRRWDSIFPSSWRPNSPVFWAGIVTLGSKVKAPIETAPTGESLRSKALVKLT